MNRLREIAVLRDAAEVDGASVQPELLAVRHESADAELPHARSRGRLEPQVIALRILRRPEHIAIRPEREVAAALAPSNDAVTVCDLIRIGVVPRNMHGERPEVLRRRDVDVRDVALGETELEMPVHAARGTEERPRGETAHIITVAEIRVV